MDEAYDRAAMAAGSASNGVFGGQIRTEVMPDLIGHLADESRSATDELHSAIGSQTPFSRTTNVPGHHN